MIAEKIKALREARGWSQAELSRRLGITRNGVNSWEQGLSMPSPACLVDLAKVFGVSTDYLLGRTENPEGVKAAGNEAPSEWPPLEFADGAMELPEVLE